MKNIDNNEFAQELFAEIEAERVTTPDGPVN